MLRISRTQQIAILMLLIPACASFAPPRSEGVSGEVSGANAPADSWSTAWDRYLSRAVPFGFTGAWLLVRDGEVVLRGGYGLADQAAGRAITPQTVTYVGSLTKQFTAAAIMKLAEQERLSPGDPISRLLPGLPPDKQSITIHHLLTHTAGLPASGPEIYAAGVDRDAYIAEVSGMQLIAEPGTQYLYSNPGYSLLAAIIELASGQTYEQYLREHLFVPAGMEKTGYVLPRWDRSELARGYLDGKDEGLPLDRESWMADGPSWRIRGAGGMLSTLDDLHRWHVALTGGVVLTKESRERLVARHVAMDENGYYGYGWAIEERPEGRVVWHNGSDGIYYAIFREWPGGAMIGWTNQPLESFQNVDETLRRALLEGTLPRHHPPAPGESGSTADEALAGTYQLTTGGILDIAMVDGDMTLTLIGQEALALVAGSAAEATDRVAAANAMAERFIAAVASAVRGDTPPATGQGDLAARMGAAVRRSAAQKGALRSSQVIGTLSAGPAAEPSTFALFQFADGPFVVELIWQGGLISGASLGVPPPARTILRSRSARELAGFDLRFGQPLTLRVVSSRASIPEVISVTTPVGTVSARRVEIGRESGTGSTTTRL